MKRRTKKVTSCRFGGAVSSNVWAGMMFVTLDCRIPTHATAMVIASLSSVLENPENGYLLNDTIIIRYTIELVVSSGGALQKQPSQPVKHNEIQVGLMMPPFLIVS
jgi:hypothetical protein